MEVVRRRAVRVVLVDSAGAVLTLSTRDATNPNFPVTWELPGGGIELGETIVEAAVREMYEETGIRIEPQDVGVPLWFREVRYLYRGERRIQNETIVVAKISGAQPCISLGLREPHELEDHQLHHWWKPLDAHATTDLFYPRTLPKHLPALLAGKIVDEPMELWD